MQPRRWDCLPDTGPPDTSRALEGVVLSYSTFLQGYCNALLDGVRVKANTDTFTIRLRTHEGGMEAWEARPHGRKVQVREVPAS